MTVAYWCVLAAAYLPIVFTGIAKSSRRMDNAKPRAYMEQISGWRQRAYWAQLNGFEAFPPFAAAVIIASVSHAPQAHIDFLAGAFIVLRVVHGICYLANQATLRTLVWFGATACTVALFISAAGSGSTAG